MILDPQSPEDEELEDQRFLDIYQEAIDLYGLIHNRFIQSPRGMAMMREKYLNGCFGICPRVLCGGQLLLPVGMSENLRHSKIKVFCPKCEEVYNPKKKLSDVDGAYFGCSFPHIFLKTYPDLAPKEKVIKYIPKIFGFKIFGKEGSIFQEQKTDTSDQNDEEIINQLTD